MRRKLTVLMAQGDFRRVLQIISQPAPATLFVIPAGIKHLAAHRSRRDLAAVIVADQGKALPRPIRHIFDKFERVDTSELSPVDRGLGLYISRKLARWAAIYRLIAPWVEARAVLFDWGVRRDSTLLLFKTRHTALDTLPSAPSPFPLDRCCDHIWLIGERCL
jgi:hypothetical protein